MTTWRERRALRRAERAHGMNRETRERTNSLIRSLDLPTGRTPFGGHQPRGDIHE